MVPCAPPHIHQYLSTPTFDHFPHSLPVVVDYARARVVMDRSTGTSNVPEVFKLSTLNIAQAKRDELYGYSKFDTRCPAIVNLVKNSFSDVICMQELRNLPTSQWSIPGFLALFSGKTNAVKYDNVYGYYDFDDASFAHAILVNRERLDVLKTTYVDTSPERVPGQAWWPRRCHAALVQCKQDQTVVFWVVSVHLSMLEKEKKRSVLKLIDTVENNPEFQGIPAVFMGDYNFFDDDDQTEQRDRMSQVFEDCAFPLANASGTFLGFEHDNYKCQPDAMARLDHIFVTPGIQKFETAFVEGEEEQITQRTYPSDHLMVSVKVTVSSTQ